MNSEVSNQRSLTLTIVPVPTFSAKVPRRTRTLPKVPHPKNTSPTFSLITLTHFFFHINLTLTPTLLIVTSKYLPTRRNITWMTYFPVLAPPHNDEKSNFGPFIIISRKIESDNLLKVQAPK